MTQINKYNFSKTDVTSIAVDTTNQNYLWVTFDQDGDGNCGIQKVSANNPLQKYFDIDLAVTKINKVYQSGTYVYLTVNDSTLLGKALSKTSPITTTIDYEIPAGITEEAVDVQINGSYTYFLIPGDVSGTNAKIVVFTTSTGAYSETIDLTTVTNASSFTFDDNNEMWVITYTSPASYVRVYDDGGWTYTVNT